MDAACTRPHRQGDHVRRERPRRRRVVRDTVPDYTNDPCYALHLEALAELRRTLDELFPNDHHAGRLGPWNDMFHRTQAEVVRLYDATLARVESRADS